MVMPTAPAISCIEAPPYPRSENSFAASRKMTDARSEPFHWPGALFESEEIETSLRLGIPPTDRSFYHLGNARRRDKSNGGVRRHCQHKIIEQGG
ncbi:hypothetical protein HOE425_300003 [Hoeflea sp. EC-HK425]|nr:hypothetical protein HOE425_300003 [Hoeflea sp. EC-HK425]